MSRRPAATTAIPAPATVRVQRAVPTHKSHALMTFRDGATYGAAPEPVGWGLPSFLGGGVALQTQVAEDKAAALAKSLLRVGTDYDGAKLALTKAVAKFAAGESYDSDALGKAWTAYAKAATALQEAALPDADDSTCSAAKADDVKAAKKLKGDARKKRGGAIASHAYECGVEVGNVNAAALDVKRKRAAVPKERDGFGQSVRNAVEAHKHRMDGVVASLA